MDVFSTADVPVGDRFAFWHELHVKLWAPYELRCEPSLESRFRAQVGVAEFGPVQATLMTTMPHSVRRTPKLIRQGDPEMFKVGCMVRGGCVLEHAGRSLAHEVGDLVLYDTSRPFSGEFAPDIAACQLLLLRFPRSLLPLPERNLRRLHAVPLSGARGVGALASQFLLQLARRMDELSPSDMARLATLTLDVLTAALASALETESAVPPHTRRRAQLAQIYAFIQQNLGDPNLTPDAIAAAHHISLRYLHKLFSEQGHTVAAWIRERRLQQCRRDLADPLLAAHTITTIAARWGFTNPTHFSRIFRGTHGLSPHEFRRQCTTVHEKK